MTILVTKFSSSKYKNEGELFTEPISENNIKLMGEMIALQVLREQCVLISKSYPNSMTDL